MALASRLATPHFWRDECLPSIEARRVLAGQGVCYGRHFHETVAIGTIVSGACLHTTERQQHRLQAGDLVIVNPGEVHDCRQIGAQPLSYRMLYLDPALIAAHQGRVGRAGFQAFAAGATAVTGRLFGDFEALHRLLFDPAQDLLAKEDALHAFLLRLNATLARDAGDQQRPPPKRKLAIAADFIHEHFREPMRLADIGAASGLSVPHLIRAFGRHFGLSPHQYLTHRRIQFAKDQLRAGRPIAAIAAEAGFADQAHLQRAFKAHVAATPGQFQRVGRSS
jgi:AraC-like DNA-binding protein